MKEANIHAIYVATEGEGIFLGIPQIFVRFQGCTIGCVNCDSMETWDFDSRQLMTMDELLNQISELGKRGTISRVSLTGGDPLHPTHRPFLSELVNRLKEKNYWINIEAAGTVVVDEVFDRVDYISFDIKTPSTGVRFNQIHLDKMFKQYGDKFQIKAVIENRHDFDFVFNLKSQYGQDNTPWCLTPSYEKGDQFPKERIISIMDWNTELGGPFRVICQQHKFVFGADRTNV